MSGPRTVPVWAHDWCIPDTERPYCRPGWRRTDRRCVYCGNVGAQTPGGSMRLLFVPIAAAGKKSQ